MDPFWFLLLRYSSCTHSNTCSPRLPLYSNHPGTTFKPSALQEWPVPILVRGSFLLSQEVSLRPRDNQDSTGPSGVVVCLSHVNFCPSWPVPDFPGFPGSSSQHRTPTELPPSSLCCNLETLKGGGVDWKPLCLVALSLIWLMSSVLKCVASRARSLDHGILWFKLDC